MCHCLLINLKLPAAWSWQFHMLMMTLIVWTALSNTSINVKVLSAFFVYCDLGVFSGTICRVNPSSSFQSRTRHIAVILIAFLTLHRISFGYFLNILLNFELEAVNYAVLTWALWAFQPRICTIDFFLNLSQCSTFE